jgi:hypothetical protein
MRLSLKTQPILEGKDFCTANPTVKFRTKASMLRIWCESQNDETQGKTTNWAQISRRLKLPSWAVISVSDTEVRVDAILSHVWGTPFSVPCSRSWLGSEFGTGSGLGIRPEMWALEMGRSLPALSCCQIWQLSLHCKPKFTLGLCSV